MYGEDLFGYLVRGWDAIFVHGRESEGFDGYLEWSDLQGHTLWVQIKTREPSQTDWPISIEPTVLERWYYQRPLLVVSVLDEGKAWWLDTDDEWWPSRPTSSRTFHVSHDRPVDSSMKEAVRRIARGRDRRYPPFQIPKGGDSVSQARSPVSKQIRVLPPEAIDGMLSDAYRRMHSASVHEKDVIALSAARIIHTRVPKFSSAMLNKYCEVVAERLCSSQLGGRTFTFGALMSVLLLGKSTRLDASVVPDLSKAAILAVRPETTFLNPEFALVVAAALVDRFPNDGERRELAQHLIIDTVLANPLKFNARVIRIARQLCSWLNFRATPLDDVIRPDWLGWQVTRPLRADAYVFLNGDEAKEAVIRFNNLASPSLATDIDRLRNDESTRMESSELLDDWLHVVGGSRYVRQRIIR
jgi:hypothetical protein